jgi:DNA-binding IclR family transcriptional regulator
MPLSISRAVKMLNRVGLEFSIEELATKLGVSLKTAKRYAVELVKMGLVVEKGSGRFAVSDKGLLLLEGGSVKGRLVGNGEAYVFVR